MARGEERLDDGGFEAFGVDHHRRSVHATSSAGQDRRVRCPCGLGPTLDACCARFLDGEAAPTAERLMRSRYTAFALGDTAHLLRSWHPDTRPSTLVLEPSIRWLGLEVLATTKGGLLEREGTVEFIARHDGGEHRERSSFTRHDGHWTYIGPASD